MLYEGLILAAGGGLAWAVSVLRRRAERQRRNYRSLEEILAEEAARGPRLLPAPPERTYASYLEQPRAFAPPPKPAAVTPITTRERGTERGTERGAA